MNITYQAAVKQVKALKALGQTEIHLEREDPKIPWHLVTKMEPGGSHRINMSTSVWFFAKDPCGLSFRWVFDIEPYSANGSNKYEIDVAACEKVLSVLVGDARVQFVKYLKECASKVRLKQIEWQGYADDQGRIAGILEGIKK